MKCKVRDLDVYYEETGSGRPLLILHGWPSDHRQMVHDMEPSFVNRDGWRRIYPDLPGMGKTRGAEWITSQDEMLDVVLEFIDAVAPGERIVLAGTSYGGYLARGLVYRRAARLDGLLLLAPAIVAEMSQRRVPQHRILREDADFLASLAPDEQNLREIVVAQSPAVLAAYRNTIKPALAVADHGFLRRIGQKYAFSFMVDELAEPFAAPTLIVTGRYDHWCGYQDAYAILDNYPRATFVVLDRAGHALAREQRTLFEVLVAEWLDRVEEYAFIARENEKQ
jgi:pimeloyl-ACP methyl ester carboxylesterase